MEYDDLDDDQAENPKEETKPEIINITQRDQAATKINKHVKGYFARQHYQDLKEQKTKTLCTSRERIEDHMIEIRVLQIVHSDGKHATKVGDVVVNAYDWSKRAFLKKLIISKDFLQHINKWEEIIELVRYYQTL